MESSGIQGATAPTAALRKRDQSVLILQAAPEKQRPVPTPPTAATGAFARKRETQAQTIHFLHNPVRFQPWTGTVPKPKLNHKTPTKDITT